MSKIKYLFSTFLAVAAFSSCVNDFDNVPEDLVIIPEGDPRAWKANMTIGELIAMYDRIDNIYVFGKDDTLKFDPDAGYTYFTLTQDPMQYPVKSVSQTDGRLKISVDYKGKSFMICRETGDTYKNLFSLTPMEAPGDIYITGRVTTCDTASNIYKYFMLEDLVDKSAIKVSIDAGSLSGIFPLGQVVSIKCNGLMMGRYAEMPQIGVYGFRNDPPNAFSPKVRFEPGRIPYSLVPEHFQRIGLPDKSKVVPEEKTIADLAGLDSTWYGRLILIKDVQFTGRGDGEELLPYDQMITIEESIKQTGNTNKYQRNPIYAPSTYSVDAGYNIGFPQSREISDGTGTVNIATSEYAHFANTLIPRKEKKGSVIAILGWFHDKNSSQGDYQLTIRSLDDLSKSFYE